MRSGRARDVFRTGKFVCVASGWAVFSAKFVWFGTAERRFVRTGYFELRVLLRLLSFHVLIGCFCHMTYGLQRQIPGNIEHNSIQIFDIFHLCGWFVLVGCVVCFHQ